VVGHRGLIGSAPVWALEKDGYSNIINCTHSELDLTVASSFSAFFNRERIDYVIMAATKVGGILANNAYSAEFIYGNLVIQASSIQFAWRNNVKCF